MQADRRILRIDASSTFEEVSRRSPIRSLTDGSLVALVYEAENVRGERSLVFESVARTKLVDEYPPAGQHVSDFDRLALWKDEGGPQSREHVR